MTSSALFAVAARPVPVSVSHLLAEAWAHGYSRERAAFPAAWVREHKFWPAVGRVESAYGDRNLVCACVPIEVYADEGYAASLAQDTD